MSRFTRSRVLPFLLAVVGLLAIGLLVSAVLPAAVVVADDFGGGVGSPKDFLHKAAFKTWLEVKSVRVKDPGKKAALKATLSSKEIFNAVYSGVHSEWESEQSDGLHGPVTDFLQWILDHSDQIIALIEKIISLFVNHSADQAQIALIIHDTFHSPVVDPISTAKPMTSCTADSCPNKAACTCPAACAAACGCGCQCNCNGRSSMVDRCRY